MYIAAIQKADRSSYALYRMMLFPMTDQWPITIPQTVFYFVRRVSPLCTGWRLDPWAAEFGRRRRILSVGRKSAENKFGQADDGVSAPPKKHFSPIELNAFLMTSSAQNNSAIYSIDLTNNLKQPRAFVTQIAFLHIFSGLFCAMHYFMAAL